VLLAPLLVAVHYLRPAWGLAMKRDKPGMYRRIVTQYVGTYGVHAGMLSLAVWSYGLQAGLRVWALSLGIPAFSALWTIMLFNYVQHVHTDPWSAHNHSRNFEGRLLNFLLFGNGYHTVHHEQASLHWADAARAHAEICSSIDDRLCHGSMFAFFFRQYLLSPFWPDLGTVQVGRAPFDDGVEPAESLRQASA